jgi:hypothetical protein
MVEQAPTDHNNTRYLSAKATAGRASTASKEA